MKSILDSRGLKGIRRNPVFTCTQFAEETFIALTRCRRRSQATRLPRSQRRCLKRNAASPRSGACNTIGTGLFSDKVKRRRLTQEADLTSPTAVLSLVNLERGITGTRDGTDLKAHAIIACFLQLHSFFFKS